MNKLATTIMCMLLSTPLQAAEAVIAGGQAALHGDLSKDQTVPVFALQWRKQEAADPGSASLSWRPYYGFEVLHGTAKAGKTDFPYDEGASLRFLGFFMTPGLCVQRELPLAACAGIGIGTLNVNSPDNRQDYGTWNYELAIRYPLTESVLMRLAGKKVGDVEQTRQGSASHFWLTSILLGLGVEY
jgi:hypothetical protein